MTDALQDTLAALAEHFAACGIDFMIVGSIAALAHGRARSTHDCDIVIEADAPRLRRLCRSLPSERFYVSEEAAIEALTHETQFNVLDLESGWKVDLILRKDRPFSRAEFARRQQRPLLDTARPVATVEDVIVAKLEWSKAAGGSARQLEDVRELLATAVDLDRAYMERWIADLGLDVQWQAATTEG